MSDTVIKIENVGKLYKLGEIGTGTISHDLNRWWARMRGKEDPFAKVGDVNDRTAKGNSDWVWALKDVSFEVKQGEVLGIIGRNGAGKSTLLKILSKVTTPTTGNIKVKGRIASLLEVGTGFHPELTGRENVFLNGAILGMTKNEIKKKFDEIVDFAGVERYIDTPVKRYSSGMYVRLAFAVAAFLEPEILIVDEVLAVGDSEFQKKCLGRMRDVSKNDGRTILFVSHNLPVIKQLCAKSVLMNKGRVEIFEKTDNVLEKYNSLISTSFSSYNNTEENKINIKSVVAKSKSSNNIFLFEETITLGIEISLTSEYFEGIHMGVAMLDDSKRKIFTTHKRLEGANKRFYQLSIPANTFLSGNYSFDIALFVPNGHVFEYLQDICSIEISDYSSEMSQYFNADTGVIQIECQWD